MLLKVVMNKQSILGITRAACAAHFFDSSLLKGCWIFQAARGQSACRASEKTGAKRRVVPFLSAETPDSQKKQIIITKIGQ